MAALDFDELTRCLLELRLVEPQTLEKCVGALSQRGRQSSSLLRLLERHNFLTSYQIEKLKVGETNGLILGGCKLLYRNASGSFARVFRASTTEDGRSVAVKVLKEKWVADPHAVAQFHREAELCQRLRHTNIVPIYDVGHEGRHHFFTMEFVEGGNLREFVHIRGRLSLVEATRCALDIASGLDYAVRQGVSHRDLKMTNVLMSSDGVAKLVDFGLAGHDDTSLHDEWPSARQTVEYATLEKGTEAPPNDPRSDLFFLGAIYYELLSGTPPFLPSKDYDERGLFSRYSNIRPLRQVAPQVPASVTTTVDGLMRLNPNERFVSASDVVAGLKRALSELSSANPAAGSQSEIARNAKSPASQTTLLIIERRSEQQDLLREYLSARGFRVLLVNDWRRGLMRLKNQPPDCVIFMGESIGEALVRGHHEIVSAASIGTFGTILVLARHQAELRDRIAESTKVRVLVQPITLKQLRRAIEQSLTQLRNA